MFGNIFKNRLTQAIASNDDDAVRKALVKKLEQKELDAALCAAAKKGASSRIAELLLNRGADIEACGSYHSTPLLLAVANGHAELAGFLLDRGANVDAKNDDYYPLWYATNTNRLDIVELLLDHGADIEICDDRGVTALMRAAEEGYRDICDILLERGASIEPSLQVAHMKGWSNAARGLAALKQGQNRKELKTDGDGFIKQDDATILHRKTMAESGIRLTKIFNFEAREVITLTETNGNTSTFVQNFADIENQNTIEKAFEALREQGGDPPGWRPGDGKPKTSVKIG